MLPAQPAFQRRDGGADRACIYSSSPRAFEYHKYCSESASRSPAHSPRQRDRGSARRSMQRSPVRYLWYSNLYRVARTMQNTAQAWG